MGSSTEESPCLPSLAICTLLLDTASPDTWLLAFLHGGEEWTGCFDNIPLGCGSYIIAFIGFLENGFGIIKDNLEADCMTYMEANGYTPEKIEQESYRAQQRRAAQMGILALMVQKLDNNPYIINSLLGPLWPSPVDLSFKTYHGILCL